MKIPTRHLNDRIVKHTVLLLIGVCVLMPSGNTIYQAFARGTSIDANGTQRKTDGGKVVDGCQLSALLNHLKVQASEPVVLQITVKNLANEEVSYIETSTEKSISLEVKNEQGEVMPLTRYGKRVFSTPEGEIISYRRIRVKLKKGEEKKFRVLVNRLYDMSVPETYFITVKKSLKTRDGKDIIFSSNPSKVIVEGFDASELAVTNPFEDQ